MTEKIYYDDNIFYLNEIIRTLSDGVRLDIDTELFLDKLVEDILFVESTLTRLFGSLQNNDLFIKRSENLKKLIRTKSLYADLLESIFLGKVPVSKHLMPFFPKFTDLCEAQRKSINDIQSLLSASVTAVGENTDTVSQEEYRFLLSEEENSEEPA